MLPEKDRVSFQIGTRLHRFTKSVVKDIFPTQGFDVEIEPGCRSANLILRCSLGEPQENNLASFNKNAPNDTATSKRLLILTRYNSGADGTQDYEEEFMVK